MFSNKHDFNKKVDEFDKKALSDYVVPIVVSILTTLIVLLLFYK